MSPLRTVCFAVGVVATATAAVAPGTPVYSLQGGGSGLETEGDYLENKIARGVYGATGNVFGAFGAVGAAAADEAKQDYRAAKSAARAARESTRDAARSARESARESVKNVKDAAMSARDSVHIPNKIGWPFDDKTVEDAKPKLSWSGGGAKQMVVDDRHAVFKFLSNPNNVFVAQGVLALVFGVVHLAKYDAFVSKFAGPVCRLFGLDWAAGAVGPHVKLVGAYLAGVLVSDVLAYKSNSAGFKRGKIWHEMGSCIAISAVCITDLFSAEQPADVVPHAIVAFLFAAWYSYLSKQY
ncbi:unnamed protein product [Pylaiella littoralis]